jgi:hypothetical protein
VLTSVAGATKGDAVAVRVADGRVHAQVTSTEQIDREIDA